MSALEKILSQLESREPLPPLFPKGVWSGELSQTILATPNAAYFGHNFSDHDERLRMDAVRSGLLLWNDDLHESHRLAQQIETPTGSFWHAIMHRREGDAANAQYWCRKTGAHPACADIYTEAMSDLDTESQPAAVALAATLQRAGTWLPAEFVKLCDAARRSRDADDWLRRLQVIEMRTLLQWCRAQVD